jgi:thiosulfate/3-mercaptopyruvate sulfurtransferase
MPSHTTLVSVAELQALQSLAPSATTTTLQVWDCSFDLLNPLLGPEQFAQGHIPGARHAHLERDLSAHRSTGVATASGGRHPLPTREAFAEWVRQQGVTPDTQVVVYDRNGMNYCGRLWWMLKWVGHEAVAVLDGGWQAWLAAGGTTETNNRPSSSPTTAVDATAPLPALTPSTLEPSGCAISLPNPGCRAVDTASLAQALGSGRYTLIDARAAARFRGETEPIDPVAGHIPGALNRPFAHNLGPDGCFKPADQLRAEFLSLLNGRDPASVVHHCGSGVSAVPNLLAMEVAGLGRQTLYPGSWSEWCTTQPPLPVATGAA